jgi:Protein of unknown function (DUF2905)
MDNNTGKIIISVGVILILIGLIVYFFGNKLHFIGHLPGDIRIERENFRFYFPITTMVLLSIIVNLLIKLYRYFFQG